MAAQQSERPTPTSSHRNGDVAARGSRAAGASRPTTVVRGARAVSAARGPRAATSSTACATARRARRDDSAPIRAGLPRSISAGWPVRVRRQRDPRTPGPGRARLQPASGRRTRSPAPASSAAAASLATWPASRAVPTAARRAARAANSVNLRCSTAAGLSRLRTATTSRTPRPALYADHRSGTNSAGTQGTPGSVAPGAAATAPSRRPPGVRDRPSAALGGRHSTRRAPVRRRTDTELAQAPVGSSRGSRIGGRHQRRLDGVEAASPAGRLGHERSPTRGDVRREFVSERVGRAARSPGRHAYAASSTLPGGPVRPRTGRSAASAGARAAEWQGAVDPRYRDAATPAALTGARLRCI